MVRDLSYEFRVTSLMDEDGGGFQATIPEFGRGVVGYGESQVEAVQDLYSLLPDFLDVLAETGQVIPSPLPAKPHLEFSGKFNVRVPKLLHAKLVETAEENGVSLNSLVTTLLAEGTTRLSLMAHSPRRPDLTVSEMLPESKLAEDRPDYSNG
jgi:antitoxin HicB